MNKTWTFIGGMLAGVASVFAIAAVATELDSHKGADNGTVDEYRSSNTKNKEEEQQLALPGCLTEIGPSM